MRKFSFMTEPEPTGRQCELCHGSETQYFPLVTFYLDRNPTNDIDANKAFVCSPCYRHLLLAMPSGIRSSLTLFAFLINRGLYTREQLGGTPDFASPKTPAFAPSKQLLL